MIFHKRAAGSREFADSGKPGARQDKFETNYVNLAIGLAVLILLAGAAFLGHWLEWEKGSTMFLHFAELWFGGVTGMFFGERLALKEE
jgi:hypothetical protein